MSQGKRPAAEGKIYEKSELNSYLASTYLYPNSLFNLNSLVNTYPYSRHIRDLANTYLYPSCLTDLNCLINIYSYSSYLLTNSLSPSYIPPKYLPLLHSYLVSDMDTDSTAGPAPRKSLRASLTAQYEARVATTLEKVDPNRAKAKAALQDLSLIHI